MKARGVWRQLTRGISALINRSAADRDIADEVEHYLEEAIEAHVARGLSRDDAYRAARLEIGNPTSVKEQVRSYGWENVLETFVADLRHGARRLRASPGFTAVSVLTLALGIGATTSIFSAVNPVLFEPLPYRHADRIVTIWYTAADGSRVPEAFGTFCEIEARSRSFEALAVMKPSQPTMTGRGEPERLEGQRVSASYFRVLGMSPLLGRDFEAADDRVNGPKVAILSHGLWQRRFAGDPAIVGSHVTLDDTSYRVTGVMPAAFENVVAPTAEVWLPLQYDVSLPGFQTREWGHHLRMVARLRPGVRQDDAWRELGTIARTPVPEFARPPWASMKQGLIVDSLKEDVTSAVKPAFVAVVGAVVLVLAIACVNVTNLLLARGAQRRGEFAMRAALGAARGRLIRQLLTESLLLAAIGGVLGMVVAGWGVGALVALSPPGLPRVDAISVDRTALVFALGISTFVGLAVGLIPAVLAARTDLRTGGQLGSARAVAGHQRTRRALVVAEVALALMLLVGAGLLFRSLQHLFAISPGFDVSHVVTMQVQLPAARYDLDAANRFFTQTIDAVHQVPGVAAAAFASQFPLSGDYNEYGVALESTRDASVAGYPAFRYAVSPGYFETTGIPLRQGRLLDRRDTADAPPAALVSESFARKLAGRNPIGQRIHVGPTDRPWFTIVGVVGDVKQTSLAASQSDAVYTTSAQWYFVDTPMSLLVRARADAAALVPSVKHAIWSVDPDVPIVRVATIDALLAATAAERRFLLVLFEAFGILALVLAATGIFGVLSGSVTERTREIGVRSALGASRGDILALVVRQGMGLTGLGVAIGLVAAPAATRGMVTMLFGISPLDAVTYASVVGLLATVAAIACGVPAWRAVRIDPATTLRAE